MWATIRRLVLTVLAAGFGWGFFWVGGSLALVHPQPGNYPFLVEYVPLPHHVPQYQGGLSFRFAMAHDVIHERFPRRGPDYYRERNRRAREQLSALAADDPARFPLGDDLGVGLERLGKSDEAVEVLREKLTRQEARGLSGRDLYTSYANLGTFLIHASAKQAMDGDPAARERFREGVGFIRKSVEVNPEAHFGRERWQAAIAEFLRASMDDPALLQTFDCLGNRLDLGIENMLDREENWVDTGYGRASDPAFSQGKVDAELPVYFRSLGALDDPARWPELGPIRLHITKIGAEQGWENVPVPSHRVPVPFDEPVLGIIGMWREGGGANPHFALALGETMLRVGQRYLAWTAFERASRLADRFRSDPAARQFLRDHCRKRQARIEETLLYQVPTTDRQLPWQQVSPPPTKAAVAGLRSQFDAELARGEGYQRAYQDYETRKIAAGVPITDKHFFDEFLKGREPIATPVGPEEWMARVPRPRMYAYLERRRQALAVFGAGLAALPMALLLRWRAGRKRAAKGKKPLTDDVWRMTEVG